MQPSAALSVAVKVTGSVLHAVTPVKPIWGPTVRAGLAPLSEMVAVCESPAAPHCLVIVAFTNTLADTAHAVGTKVIKRVGVSTTPDCPVSLSFQPAGMF